MKLFGITGGVGMGKSTTASFLEKTGVAVLDTDLIARQLVEPGQPALAEIVAAFGSSILSPDGSLNRKDLARRVFGDIPARAKLESILHPKIRQIWEADVIKWRDADRESGKQNWTRHGWVVPEICANKRRFRPANPLAKWCAR